MSITVRTRFAPSPTGGLHLGGVRTALFSYLYAKKHNGQFVLRIEDTDQNRFLAGAEDYIVATLNWCGLAPDESPMIGGPYAPYRQSERKEMYKQYALQLIESGHAYYAFDTSEDLEKMRNDNRTAENTNPQYDGRCRMKMNNSESLPKEKVAELLANNTPYVVRIKVPQNETIIFHDLIRGEVNFDSNLIDDKVLLKADGMPTYHLAVVVDDYLMKISHAFRGEEWLPSAPIHILLWQYLGWKNDMPEWAHLPLILKPDGNGKLSKRDGERLGFPVFAMDWADATTGEMIKGFKELGFLPEAFINILAMLGWNDGTDKEMFSKEELIENFEITRIHKGGAKFSYEKAKWYNAEYIKLLNEGDFEKLFLPILQKENATIIADEKFYAVCNLVKERCVLLNDIATQALFFYEAPKQIDTESIAPKWSAEKTDFFKTFANELANITEWNATNIEHHFKELATSKNIKPNELQLPMRIMLVGGKFGPGVFIISELIGKDAVKKRVETALLLLQQ
jgi:glutamyl-tRNA synthetase